MALRGNKTENYISASYLLHILCNEYEIWFGHTNMIYSLFSLKLKEWFMVNKIELVGVILVVGHKIEIT